MSTISSVQSSPRHTLLLAFAVLSLVACGGNDEAAAPAGEQAAKSAAVAPGHVAKSAGKSAYGACQSCHGIDGGGNQAMNAPSLLNQSKWYLKRQLQNFKSGVRGSHKRDVYGMQMVAFANTLADEAAIDAVLEHIDGLRDRAPRATVKGNIERGADFYSNVCGACHGPAAEGNEMLQSPALAGVDDWYLLRQLKNFEKGLRGADESDKYGHQMAMMVSALPDDETARDVVAYIQSLAK